MTDAEREAMARIDALPEPSRTMAKLLVDAGRWAMAGSIVGLELCVYLPDGQRLRCEAGTHSDASHARLTHEGSEARH